MDRRSPSPCGEGRRLSGQDSLNRRASSGAQGLGISTDQLTRLQHLAEQSFTDKTSLSPAGGVFTPEYGSTLGSELLTPPCYVPERRSSWAPEPRKNSVTHEEADINSNTGTVFKVKGAPDITISALPVSHSAHNMANNYRRGSDVVVQRRRTSDFDHDEDFDEAFQQYRAREKRRKSSVMWRKDETKIDADRTRTNFIVISFIIVAIISSVIGLKLLYF